MQERTTVVRQSAERGAEARLARSTTERPRTAQRAEAPSEAARQRTTPKAALGATAIIISVVGCGSTPVLPLEAPDRVDRRLESARSIARGGVPSPTPQLDAMAAALTSGASTRGLEALLAARSERLRVGDQVLVTCVGLPELSGERAVGQDGQVPGPVGLLRAAGLTTDELAAAIAGQLESTYTQVPEHHVTVRLVARAPRAVQVIGRVGAHAGAPGVPGAAGAAAMTTTLPLPPDDALSVYEAIALAQGLAADADDARVSLIRHEGGAGEPRTACYQFTFGELVKAHLAGRDAALHAGDQLVVPRLPDVFVYGEVIAPGRYTLRPGTTVASLLLVAGGVTLEADTAGALALGRDGSETPATPATPLSPGQVLFVPQVQRVYVVGPGAARNGPLVLPAAGLTVIQALSEAGWFTQYGDSDGVEILRSEAGRRVTIEVPVDDILEGEVDERDFLLRPGDTVLVPEGIW